MIEEFNVNSKAEEEVFLFTQLQHELT